MSLEEVFLAHSGRFPLDRTKMGRLLNAELSLRAKMYAPVPDRTSNPDNRNLDDAGSSPARGANPTWKDIKRIRESHLKEMAKIKSEKWTLGCK